MGAGGNAGSRGVLTPLSCTAQLSHLTPSTIFCSASTAVAAPSSEICSGSGSGSGPSITAPPPPVLSGLGSVGLCAGSDRFASVSWTCSASPSTLSKGPSSSDKPHPPGESVSAAAAASSSDDQEGAAISRAACVAGRWGTAGPSSAPLDGGALGFWVSPAASSSSSESLRPAKRASSGSSSSSWSRGLPGEPGGGFGPGSGASAGGAGARCAAPAAAWRAAFLAAAYSARARMSARETLPLFWLFSFSVDDWAA